MDLINSTFYYEKDIYFQTIIYITNIHILWDKSYYGTNYYSLAIIFYSKNLIVSQCYIVHCLTRITFIILKKILMLIFKIFKIMNDLKKKLNQKNYLKCNLKGLYFIVSTFFF